MEDTGVSKQLFRYAMRPALLIYKGGKSIRERHCTSHKREEAFTPYDLENKVRLLYFLAFLNGFLTL